MLLFEAGGKIPGSIVRLEKNARQVHVVARALSRYPIDRLEIIVNGAVEHRLMGKGGPRELFFDARVAIPESAWIAARVRGRVEPITYGGTAPWNLHAHSSPVYVYKGSQPILQRADATAMADYIRFIAEEYRRKGDFKTEHQRQMLFSNLKRAEGYYEGLLA